MGDDSKENPLRTSPLRLPAMRNGNMPGTHMPYTHKGCSTVMVVAFDDDGRLNVDAQARFTDRQVRKGSHGFLPPGATGGIPSLTADRRRDPRECVIGAASVRVPVYAGSGTERTEDVPENCRTAERLGADGAIIVPSIPLQPGRSC